MRLMLAACLAAVTLACGGGSETPPAEAPVTPAPADTGVPYRLVARGGGGLDVEIDGKVVGALDPNGELTVTLEPRETCYEIHVRLTPEATRGDCYVVSAPSPGPAGAPPPLRQIVWDLGGGPPEEGE